MARLLKEERTSTAIFIEARKTGYTPELFSELLELYKLHFAEATGIINVIQLASEQWPNFNFKNAISLIKKEFSRDASVIIDKAFPPGIKETEQKIKSVKEFAKKMKNKPLKLKEETMFNHLQMLIKKAILYKRKHLKEDIVKKEKNLPASKDKKAELKKIYKRILTGTPYEENIPMFMKLIDMVSNNYVNYELGINLDNAMKMVDELISGQGDFTPEELKNIINITKGIGFPAIEHYAAGGKVMPKEQQVFGAHHMDQNVKELMGSLEQRRSLKNKLPAPDTENKKMIGTTTPDIIHREVVPTEELRVGLTNKFNSRIARIISMPQVANTEFWRVASQMKTGGMNTERLAKSMADVIINSKTYEEAKEKAQEKLHLDFSKEDNLFKSFFKEKARQSEGIRVKKTNEGTIKNFINKEEKPDEESENEKVPSKEVLVAWIKKHPNFEDEVLHAWVEKNGWNIHEVEDMIYKFATKEIKQNEGTKMNLKDYLLCEEIKKEINLILEVSPRAPLPKKVGEKMKKERDNKTATLYSKPPIPDSLMIRKNKTKENSNLLLPMLSAEDNKELAKKIKRLKLFGGDTTQIYNTINQRRKEHGYPPISSTKKLEKSERQYKTLVGPIYPLTGPEGIKIRDRKKEKGNIIERHLLGNKERGDIVNIERHDYRILRKLPDGSYRLKALKSKSDRDFLDLVSR